MRWDVVAFAAAVVTLLVVNAGVWDLGKPMERYFTAGLSASVVLVIAIVLNVGSEDRR